MKKFILFYLGLVILSLPSCNDFLEPQPVSFATDQNFWKNGDEANSAVAGSYALLRQAMMDANGLTYFAYGDLATPEFRSTLPGEDWGNIGDGRWNVAIPASNTWRSMMRLRRFDSFYQAIDQANRCIKYIPGIPVSEFSSEQVKNSYLGEAYFMRAFVYFYMARVWGDVPLVLTSADLATDFTTPVRTSQELVLQQCIKDLNSAIPLLQYNYNVNVSDRAVRANRGTAFALLAHLQAWRGNYSATIAATDSVIEFGGYGYAGRDSTSYRNIFKGQSTEGIFEISMNQSNEKASLGSIAFMTLRAPYFRTATTAALPLEPEYLHTLFADSTDQRYRHAFAYWNSTDPICIKYANVTYTSTDPIAANNIIVFRYSDIKLLRAEALAAEGQYGSARLLLDEVRQLAGLPPSTAEDPDLFSSIMEERQRELFLEGHCFYDMIRLARKTGELRFGGIPERMSTADFLAGKYYWPLDPVLISLNRKLTQTPFWMSRM